MSDGLAPIPLGPNQPDRPYLGGAGIAALRGVAAEDAYRSEDFIASVTEVFAGGGVGLSRLPDGRLLRNVIDADPEPFLGAAHVARFGTSTELLVKLLDTGERLFVHLHPDAGFASRELGAQHGKTEAWIVVGTRQVDDQPAAPYALVGFTRAVSAEEVERWVEEQDVAGMQAAMHRLELAEGDTLFVPAGVPHAIGPGITLVELQEPTDLSILLEYTGYRGLGPDDAFLGLPREVALSALDRTAASADELAVLLGRGEALRGAPGARRLLPATAEPFFRATRVDAEPGTPVALPRGFAVLVILDGAGVLDWIDGSLPVTRGDTLVIPDAIGDTRLTGAVGGILCRPPLP